METKTQDTATKNELMDFSAIMESVLALIEKHWNVKVSPKGYKKFLEDYEEYKGMGEDQYDLHQEFQDLGGIYNASASTPGLPGRIDLPTVAHDDKQQGRSPWQTLAGALFGYGQAIGAAQERRFADGGPTNQELRMTLLELYEDRTAMREEIKQLKTELASLKDKKSE